MAVASCIILKISWIDGPGSRFEGFGKAAGKVLNTEIGWLVLRIARWARRELGGGLVSFEAMVQYWSLTKEIEFAWVPSSEMCDNQYSFPVREKKRIIKICWHTRFETE